MEATDSFLYIFFVSGLIIVYTDMVIKYINIDITCIHDDSLFVVAAMHFFETCFFLFLFNSPYYSVKMWKKRYN